MADLDTLRSLRERVTAATGADRTLDWELHWLNGIQGIGSYGAHPAYTASIDAAVALVERCLPGWRGDIDIAALEPGVTLYGARLFPAGGTFFYHAGEAITPPLALLDALLSALLARQKGASDAE